MKTASSVVIVWMMLTAWLLQQAPERGHFVGEVVVRWLEQDGVDRDMELVQPFVYVDPSGKRWAVPSGAIVNGASIPQSLWMFGSPYTGDYRRASVVHDYHCTIRTEAWRLVHRMFLNAAIDGGLAIVSAKTMYAGIMLGGPRWDLKPTRNLEGGVDMVAVPLPMVRPAEAELEDLRQWVERTDPTADQIDAEVSRRMALR